MEKKKKMNSVRASSRRPDQRTVTDIEVTTNKRHKFLDDLIQSLRDGAEVESVELRVTLRNSQSPGERTVVSGVVAPASKILKEIVVHRTKSSRTGS